MLPERLMKEACRQPLSRKAALQAQMAAALEIGLMAPIRLANVAALEIGQHLCFFGEGRREWSIINLPQEMVKNEIALEFPLTTVSTALIKTYIHKFLPIL